jgi:antitoxin component YwqK of YwqJK toxin-antitoxin module
MWEARGMTRCILFVALASIAGCAHYGDQSTPSSNTLVMGRAGIPEFLGGTNRCPAANGEGAIQKTWANGEVLHKGTCTGGLMTGQWTAYYENGAKEWTAFFEGGLIVGTFKSWWANDQERASVAFVQGVPDGTFKSWHLNGQLAMQGKYVGGKPNGCWETWHDNGQVASKGTYANGTPVLTWLYWTADGAKRKDKLGGEATNGQCLVTL